ncbi:rod shape-determining protein RodA [Streptomyces sp. ACA25]|nr:rod shape-determining protein RodA [Streptomyces sp. ACA25]MDB1089520.1 rod shape-determining protein RodA [Streptomyces sp. ACA25]
MRSYSGEYADERAGLQPTAWTRITDRNSRVRQLDWVLLGSAFALTLLGTLLVYSATRGRNDLHQGDEYFFLVRHLLYFALALGLATGVMRLGSGRVRDVAPVLYVGALVLTAMVLTPLGSTVNGSQRWIEVGAGFAFQPSELMKVAVILVMAALVAARADADDRGSPDARTVLECLALAAVPATLIVLTPDLGQTMVVVVITLGVLMAAGAARGWIIGLLSAGLLGALAVWQLGLLDQYQINRFAAFANPALDPAGVGYNTNQARIAIGSGGLSGSGLFHGSQTAGQFVPEQHTDFIFTVAGEELGFFGAGGIILLLGVVLWRALRIAREAADLFGAVVAAGLATWIAFQAFENIGMALGIMPVTGLPLPFVSYGGSSMFAVWIAVGLLQAIRLRARRRC